MKATILITLLAVLTANLFSQQSTNNADKDAFKKRLYLSTSDDPLAILKAKSVTNFDLQVRHTNKSKLKSTQATVSLIDSTYSYQWDAVVQNWETNINIKEKYIYNNKNLLTSLTQYSQGNTINVWNPVLRVLYNYNSEDLREVSITQFWQPGLSGINEWINSSKDSTVYNTDGSKSMFYSQYWDSDINSWINSWRHNFSYNVKGLNDTITEENWDSDAAIWVLGYQYVNDYNQSGFLENNKTLQWDANNSIWQNQAQTIYDNDSNGMDTCITSQNWDAATNFWVNNIQKKQFYNSKMLPLYYDSYKWVENNWEAFRKGNYIYGLNNSYVLLEKMYDITEGWVNSWSSEIAYNEALKDTSNAYLSWDVTLNMWGSGSKTISFYAEHQSIPSSVNMNDWNFYVYPNPTKGKIYIKTQNRFDEIIIFNITGETVIVKQSFENKTDIDLSGLKAGIYFGKAKSLGETESFFKILKY